MRIESANQGNTDSTTKTHTVPNPLIMSILSSYAKTVEWKKYKSISAFKYTPKNVKQTYFYNVILAKISILE